MAFIKGKIHGHGKVMAINANMPFISTFGKQHDGLGEIHYSYVI